MIANAAAFDAATGGGRWTLRYPDHFTALSPMLVIAPADELEMRRGSIILPDRDRSLELLCARHTEVDADLAGCEADIKSWLPYTVPATALGSTATRSGRGVGPRARHGVRRRDPASVPALEHEVSTAGSGGG